jgi:hypothetical protein
MKFQIAGKIAMNEAPVNGRGIMKRVQRTFLSLTVFSLGITASFDDAAAWNYFIITIGPYTVVTVH